MLTSAMCHEMIRDRSNKFWTMWSSNSGGDYWRKRTHKEPGCWGGRTSASRYWAGAAAGDKCGWDWGSRLDAPAVFGFAETMEQFCSGRGRRLGEANNTTDVAERGRRTDLKSACAGAGINLLRIGQWNMCKNIEWMFCVITGLLAGHGGGLDIIFSLAPKELDVGKFYRNAYPRCCGAYAENDIYYLEVCVLNEVCSNRKRLFALDRGDYFRCEFDQKGYESMQEGLMRWDPPSAY